MSRRIFFSIIFLLCSSLFVKPAFAAGPIIAQWHGVVNAISTCDGWTVDFSGTYHPETASWAVVSGDGTSGSWSDSKTSASGQVQVSWSDSSETFTYSWSAAKPSNCATPTPTPTPYPPENIAVRVIVTCAGYQVVIVDNPPGYSLSVLDGDQLSNTWHVLFAGGHVRVTGPNGFVKDFEWFTDQPVNSGCFTNAQRKVSPPPYVPPTKVCEYKNESIFQYVGATVTFFNGDGEALAPKHTFTVRADGNRGVITWVSGSPDSTNLGIIKVYVGGVYMWTWNNCNYVP